MVKSVCFILMPFGRKADSTGRLIDFDAIHRQIIAPAIERAGLTAVRADEEQACGFIHKLMYERLLLSEYAVADLTILNANVYYELGIRHAARPSTTIMVMAEGAPMPFDVSGLRTLPYALGPDGLPQSPEADSHLLGERLKASLARDLVDSPLYQMLDSLSPPPIAHEKTDIFRERVLYSQEAKALLAEARRNGASDAVRQVATKLGSLETLEAGVAIDLLLSYRAVGDHAAMVEAVDSMDRTLAATVFVQEQRAFALNRLGRFPEAETLLKGLVARRGPSSETNGLLGRIYKDRWRAAVARGDVIEARAFLRKSIETYLAGFHADIRDSYPGVNALTLMDIANDPRRAALLPVVRYAIELRCGQSGGGDYWDSATLLELALMADDEEQAADALGEALSADCEGWQRETTVANLEDIARARRGRGAATALIEAAQARLIAPASD